MKTFYVVKNRPVSKWGIDRGEIGGLERVNWFDTFEEAQNKFKESMTSDQYRGLSFSEQKKLSNNQNIFLWPPQFYKYTELFNKEKYVKFQRAPKVNNYPEYYLQGEWLGAKARFRYFGSKSNNFIELWNMLKNKKVELATIYGVEKIEK